MPASGKRSVFSSLARLTIRTKTFAASAIALICLIGMGATVELTSSQVARNLHELYRSNLPTRGAAATVNNAVIAAHIMVFRYVSWASNGVNAELLQKLHSDIDADFRVIQKNFKELAERPDLSAAEKTDLKSLQTKLAQYQSTANDVLGVGATDPAMATMMLGQTDDKFTNIETDIRKILTAISAQSDRIVRNSFRGHPNRNVFARNRTVHLPCLQHCCHCLYRRVHCQTDYGNYERDAEIVDRRH